MSLEDAQRAKWRRIAETLDLKPGPSRAGNRLRLGRLRHVSPRANMAAMSPALRLSTEQLAYATAEAARAGFPIRSISACRIIATCEGQFDRIASIEMFEAVGEENWPGYFDVVRERLKPDGVAGLQIITIADSDFEIYRRDPDFIQLYIFPGGMLPSPTALKTVATGRGLGFETVRTFAGSYAETLRRWRETFDTRWPTIAPLGFDERFGGCGTITLRPAKAGFGPARSMSDSFG